VRRSVTNITGVDVTGRHRRQASIRAEKDTMRSSVTRLRATTVDDVGQENQEDDTATNYSR